MPSPANINVWLLPLSILSFHLKTVDAQATFVRPGLPIGVQLFRDLVLRAFLITSAPLPHLAEHEFRGAVFLVAYWGCIDGMSSRAWRCISAVIFTPAGTWFVGDSS